MGSKAARASTFQDVVAQIHSEDLRYAINLLEREARRSSEFLAKRSGTSWGGPSPLQDRACRAQRAANALRQIARMLPAPASAGSDVGGARV